MNLAIFSPGKDTYSETFIQAHKKIKADKVFFYYNQTLPTHLEGEGIISICREALNFTTLFTLSRKINPFSKLFWKLSLKEYFLAKSLKKHKIDVVLAEFGTTGIYALNVCKFLGIPLVTHFHGADITAGLETYREQYKELIKHSAYVVGVSREMVSTLKNDLGATEEQAVYTPCGPNAMFANTIPDRKSQTFLSVGRFVDKKAPYYTILAFNNVLKAFPKAKLLMVGEGPLLNMCCNLVRYLKITDNVKFLGVKSPEEIGQLHNQVCAFIQHSLTAINGDKEGTPVGIMEASLSSLPVISTFHAGISDVIIDGETGLLCEEHDVESMTQNMLSILKDPLNAEKMGLQGRYFINENFSQKKHIDILSNILMDAYMTKCHR